MSPRGCDVTLTHGYMMSMRFPVRAFATVLAAPFAAVFAAAIITPAIALAQPLRTVAGIQPVAVSNAPAAAPAASQWNPPAESLRPAAATSTTAATTTDAGESVNLYAPSQGTALLSAAYPVPREVVVRNYARRGAIIGALGTGTIAALVSGYYAKRDCDPGLCDSEFRRGAFVGGVVGVAAGGVLGWLIGSAITDE